MDIPLSRADEIIKSGKLVFSPQLGTFTVMGFSDVPRVVRLYPTEYCSCGVKTTCYHKKAVKKSIGLEIETRRKINLTELKRKRKPKGEGKSGTKRPRANDYDVFTADPGRHGFQQKLRFLKRILVSIRHGLSLGRHGFQQKTWSHPSRITARPSRISAKT